MRHALHPFRAALPLLGLGALILSTSPAWPQNAAAATAPAEVTLVLDSGKGYGGATDDDRAGSGDLKAHVNGATRHSVGRLLRFGGLPEWIRGEGIEVLDARLDLFYYDEYWSTRVYHVAVSRSLDGSVTRIADEPESVVPVVGNRLPAREHTPLKSWVSFAIKPETIALWHRDEAQNRGLVIHVPRMNKANGAKWWERDPDAPEATEDLALVAGSDMGEALLGPYFRSTQGPPAERPRLTVRYRITGNAPPSSPGLADAPTAPRRLSGSIRLALVPAVDPNADAFAYETETAFGGQEKGLAWRKASAAVAADGVVWDFERDWSGLAGTTAGGSKEGLWLRIRAVDSKGAASRWETVGPYARAERPWTVWGTHGNLKLWPDIQPTRAHLETIRIQAARNEWEPCQVAVMGHQALSGVEIRPGAFADGRGHAIAAPVAYRQHYLMIDDTANKSVARTGLVPDALVPLRHPLTGEATGGKYGGCTFAIPAGKLESFWLDVYVGNDTPAGIYRGAVQVSAKGLDAVSLPVEIEVFDFALPSPKSLRGMFQLAADSAAIRTHAAEQKSASEKAALAHLYEEMLHEHYIDNWSPITGWNYGLNRVVITEQDGKLSVDWSAFDRLVEPYMEGSAFRDRIAARCLFVPYYLPIKGGGRLKSRNYKEIDFDLFGQWVADVQRHFEAKGWLDSAYFFYFDEPFLSEWKYDAFLRTAKIVRAKAPKLRIMITDGYMGEAEYKKLSHIAEPITPYVDVWNPVTFQVRDMEQASFYRNRKAAGHFDIWCQTLGNASKLSPLPALFPEYDMPFHRTWGAQSWSLGFQGLELWDTVYGERNGKRVDPWTDSVAFPVYDRPLNCDGRLFYPGTPDAIGGPDIPIASLRMKSLRDAIEDYEYLRILDRLGHTPAEFSVGLLHTTREEESRAMVRPMAMGRPQRWQWWEGDPDAMLAAREKAARLIVRKQKGR